MAPVDRGEPLADAMTDRISRGALRRASMHEHVEVGHVK